MKKLYIKKILIIIFIFASLFLGGILIYINFFQNDKVAVLTYHDIVEKVNDDPKATVNISTKKFESQIKWLSEHNYHSLTMDEFYDWKMNNKKIPRKSVLITFDDGWKSFYTTAVPILEKYNMHGSVFIVFKYTENCTINNKDIYMNFNDINDIIINHKNMEILSHSYNLHDRENAESNNYEFYSDDIDKVKSMYKEIKYYAYPFGINNTNYIKALRDKNYRMAFTFGPYDFVSKNNNNFQLPRFGMFESTKEWKFKLKMLLKI